jgi:hypothetical protein
MFALIIYRLRDRELFIDRVLGGFNSNEDALKYAEKHEFIPGQDFSVIEVEHHEAEYDYPQPVKES